MTRLSKDPSDSGNSVRSVCHQPVMLLGRDLGGLIDEQHRDGVLDAVGPAQPRVVEDRLGAVIDQQQWPAVGRAHQDVEQFAIHAG